jgi:hypothetical protein
MQLTIRSKIQRCKKIEIGFENIVRRREIKSKNKR